MPWFKVDDNLAFHQKVLRAGNAAMGMWVRAGAECSNQLTDGFVSDELVGLLGGRGLARKLVAARLWIEAEGGYQFHEWNESGRQPTREQVERDRKAAQTRKERWKERRQDDDGTPVGTAAERRSERRSERSQNDAHARAVPDPTRPDPVTTEDQDLGGERTETLQPPPATQHPPHNDPPTAPSNARCTKHQGITDPGPCNGCRTARENAERAADRAADLAAREHEARRLACTRCDGTWIVDEQQRPTRRKCDHRRSA